MYCFVNTHDGNLNIIQGIEEKKCNLVLSAAESTHEVLEFYILGKCVADAWHQLKTWGLETKLDTNHLFRDLHTAERLVRSFLFEFRTCLDHMETEIKQKYGKSSDLWRIFHENTSKAYDDCPEYGFTYHFRNCSQHCKNVVHGFCGATGTKISSNTKKLLEEYDSWKETDKEYMRNCGENIDLLQTFSKCFSAFNTALIPVVGYLLNNNGVGNDLMYLREWGDYLSNCYQLDVSSFHLAEFEDSENQEDLNENVKINAFPIDWEMVYELTDSIIQH